MSKVGGLSGGIGGIELKRKKEKKTRGRGKQCYDCREGKR